MDSYQIKKLKPEEYNKCNNIWDMEKKMAKVFYDELVSGKQNYFYLLQ